MENSKLRIGGGGTECFFIVDPTLNETSAPFYEWLRTEGFEFGGYHGNFGCASAYVNITRKQYAYGMPGVCLAQPIGNHAITIDEFKTIYSIYKKYEGKAPQAMNTAIPTNE